MIWFEEAGDAGGRQPIVRPPFSRASHALWGAALIILLLVGPSLLERIAPADPASVYRAMPSSYGNYYTIGQEISKPGRIDVLIIGASDAWTSLDPRIIKSRLEAKYQRPMRVLNLGTNWAGEERNAQVLHDVLSKHEVNLVLFPETDAAPTAPHELAKYWWRGDVAVEGLELRNQAQLAMMTVVGFPRTFWSRFQTPETAPLDASAQSAARTQEAVLGFNAAQIGWKSHSDGDGSPRRPYEEKTAPAPSVSGKELFYRGDGDERFEVRADHYFPMQTPFVRASRDMVRAQGGVFATFCIPSHFQTEPLTKPWLRVHDGLERDWPTFGISQTQLFPGMSFDEMLNFYGNESHLNETGARAYTTAVMPAIEDLYAQAIAD